MAAPTTKKIFNGRRYKMPRKKTESSVTGIGAGIDW
jgi:hypothetical protein